MPRKTRKQMLNPRRKGAPAKPKAWTDEDKFFVNLRKAMNIGKDNKSDKSNSRKN